MLQAVSAFGGFCTRFRRPRSNFFCFVSRPYYWYSVASVVVCNVKYKRCVLQQKLLLTGSRVWEIDWCRNEWPWLCL